MGAVTFGTEDAINLVHFCRGQLRAPYSAKLSSVPLLRVALLAARDHSRRIVADPLTVDADDAREIARDIASAARLVRSMKPPEARALRRSTRKSTQSIAADLDRLSLTVVAALQNGSPAVVIRSVDDEFGHLKGRVTQVIEAAGDGNVAVVAVLLPDLIRSATRLADNSPYTRDIAEFLFGVRMMIGGMNVLDDPSTN